MYYFIIILIKNNFILLLQDHLAIVDTTWALCNTTATWDLEFPTRPLNCFECKFFLFGLQTIMIMYKLSLAFSSFG